MAINRQVRRHENSRMWGYVEWSDENLNHFILLGGKEFFTKEEAEDYSKHFDPNGYEESVEWKNKLLIAEKEKLEKRLTEINSILGNT